MAANYRTDVILAAADQVTDPEKIDELNAVLEKDGLGRPLHRGTRSITSSVVEIPVAGVDPVVIRDALCRADQGRGAVPGTGLAYQYVASTVEDNAVSRELFQAAGKKSGHGTIAWLSAPRFEMKDRPPVSGAGRPVIALLDSGVLDHEWLRDDDGRMSFLIGAPDQPSPEADGGGAGGFGSHRGHGTFMAGLIRLAAPPARVLSVQVMDDHGKVEQGRLLAGLATLAEHLDTQPVDVVCMAFGRPRVGTDTFDPVLDALKRLIDKGVKVVASAGNDGSDVPVYPAAYAAELRDVVSVGASTSPTERAPFSNYGPWVREWRNGTNVVSVMPLVPKEGMHFALGSNYAWWSGTSFAAATYAGELAATPGSRP
jgi:hypothetical protein